MSLQKKVVSLSLIALLLGAGYCAYKFFYVSSSEMHVVEYDPALDREDAIRSFYENFHWMVLGGDRSTHSFGHFLDTRTSSQDPDQAKPMAIKVVRINNKFAGLVTYLTYQDKVGQILFLLTDQKHRRKGLGRTLIKYAMQELIKSGHEILFLFTRQDNIRAQSLYKSFGFVASEPDEDGVITFVYHVKQKDSEQGS